MPRLRRQRQARLRNQLYALLIKVDLALLLPYLYDLFVSIECFIAQQSSSFKLGYKGIRSLKVARLPRRQQEFERIAQSVDKSMDFRAQSAL